ncbi:MAG: NAD(P)-dependent oxidoreductase [Anaerolineales bacterium]
MRILNAEPLMYSDQARAILLSLGELVEEPVDRARLLTLAPDFDVLIVRLGHQIDREILDAGARLKAIVTATTGLDHIDLVYAAEKGIAVLSLRGEIDFLRTVSATAEHTWALLLALLRNIPSSFASVRAGNWNRDSFRGRELEGRRLGLLGLGRIGQKVARYGLAFDMSVFACDPYALQWVDGVARCVSLPELLGNSDVLSIHVPLNSETIGLIGKEELQLLPPTSILLNTSRAEVVDANALLDVLNAGSLAGAALDFIPEERDAEKRLSSPLLEYARKHENLLITPHLGGATYESMRKTEIFMAQKLFAWAQTEYKSMKGFHEK